MDERRRIPRVDGTKVGNMADALKMAGMALELLELKGDLDKLDKTSQEVARNACEMVMKVQREIWLAPTPTNEVRTSQGASLTLVGAG